MGKLISRYIIKIYLHILYPITLTIDIIVIIICWLSGIKIKKYFKLTEILKNIIIFI